MTARFLLSVFLCCIATLCACSAPQEAPSLESFRVDYATSGCGVVEGFWAIEDGTIVQDVVQAEGDATMDVAISATGDVLDVPWRIGAEAAAAVEVQDGDAPTVDARACVVVDWAILNLVQCVPETTE